MAGEETPPISSNGSIPIHGSNLSNEGIPPISVDESNLSTAVEEISILLDQSNLSTTVEGIPPVSVDESNLAMVEEEIPRVLLSATNTIEYMLNNGSVFSLLQNPLFENTVELLVLLIIRYRSRSIPLQTNPFLQNLFTLVQAISAGDLHLAPVALIGELKTVTKEENQGIESDECVVCLEGLIEREDAVVKEMPCRHRFHLMCIGTWLMSNASCPVCRYTMPEETEEDEEQSMAETIEEGGDGIMNGRGGDHVD